MASTWYVDPIGGNDANTGASFAQRIKLLSALAGKGAVAGDTARVIKSADPVSMGINLTLTDGSNSITLASACTKNIELMESGWTAGTGITATHVTTVTKEGTNNLSLVVGGGHTKGTLAAYKGMSSTDFSAYQQISFWFISTATSAAGDWVIKLCSDTLGVTSVCSFNVPAIEVANTWHRMVVDFGSAMSGATAIQSVAIYSGAALAGTPTVRIDNLFATYGPAAANVLTLRHLIGTNVAPTSTTSGVKEWFPIQSVNGTTVKIDMGNDYSSVFTPAIYISDNSGTPVAAYSLLPSYVAAGSGSPPVGTLAGGDFIVSGGWNSTDMSTQTGESWFGLIHGGAIDTWSGNTRVAMSKLSAVFGRYGLNISTCVGASLDSCHAVGQSTITHYIFSYMNTVANCFSLGSFYGLQFYGSNNILKNCRFQAGQYESVYWGATGSIADKCSFSTVGNNGGIAFTSGIAGHANAGNGYNIVRNCAFNRCGGSSVSGASASEWFDNCLMNDSTEFLPGSFTSFGGMYMYSTNHDQTAGNHQQFTDGGKIISDSTTRHTASGIAWKFSPTSTNRNSQYPLKTKIATVYCVSGVQTTVSAYFAKDHANISVGLFIRGGQLGGPASDTTQLSTCGTGSTYESTATQIQWTPTSTGWVEIEAICYTSASTTSNGWVDDFGCVYG